MFKNGQKRNEGGLHSSISVVKSIGGDTINHLYRRHIRKINSLTPFFNPLTLLI